LKYPLTGKEFIMLVVSRKIGESILIGRNGEIKVVFLGLKYGHYRLGVEAPPGVPVHREEVRKKIDRQINPTHAQ